MVKKSIPINKDSKYKIFQELINKLKDEWFNDIKPFIEFDKPQGRKYDKFAAPYPIVGEPNPKVQALPCVKKGFGFCTESFNGVGLFTSKTECEYKKRKECSPPTSHYDERYVAGSNMAVMPDGSLVPIMSEPDNPYEMGGMFFNREKAKWIEQRKLANIFKSLQFQFIQKLCAEVNRAMLIVCCELGYKSKDFDLSSFFKFSDGLLNDKDKPKIDTFPKYKAFNLLFKMNNFLKHNTVKSYLTLKEYFPDNILKGSGRYENGMYAGDFIYLQDGYLDKIFDKLLIFFAEYCKNVLGENIE